MNLERWERLASLRRARGVDRGSILHGCSSVGLGLESPDLSRKETNHLRTKARQYRLDCAAAENGGEVGRVYFRA